MSGALQGTIILQLQSESVVANSAKVEDSLKRVKTSANDAGKEVEFSAKRAAAGMTGLVTNTAAAAFAYKNLGDMQLNVAKAHARLEERQQKLNKLQNDSKSSLQDIADAQRDVNIANEQYKQTLDRVNDANIQFILTTGTMAVTTIPAAISAMKGLNLSMFSFSKILDVIKAHPVFFAVSAGILLWEFGISKLIKNYNGLDLSISGNLEKLAGQKTAISDINVEMEQYNSNIGTQTSELDRNTSAIQRNTSGVRDLGREYQSTLNQIKKNETELNNILNEDLFLMGSLSSFVADLEAQGVFETVREFQRDARRVVPTALVGEEREAQKKRILAEAAKRFALRANANQNISFATSLASKDAAFLSNISSQINSVIDAFRPYGDSLDSVIRSALGNVRGVPQSVAGNIVNAGRGGGSTRSVSGSGKARRGGFGGGDKGEARFFESMNREHQAALSIVQELALLGYNISAPSYPTRVGANQYGFDWRGGQVSTFFVAPEIQAQIATKYAHDVAEYNRQVSAARAEVTDRAQFIGLSYSQYLSQYQTTQGRSDIEGMTLYKKLAAMA